MNGRKTTVSNHCKPGRTTFFRIYGDEKVDDYDPSKSDYPPLPIRRYVSIYLANAAVNEHWNTPGTAPEVITNSLIQGAIYPEEAFSILTGREGVTSGFAEVFCERGLEYGRKLDEYWSTSMAQKISQFAYEFDTREIRTKK